MPAWRPLAGLIRSLSAVLERVTRHSSAACGFHPQTGTGLCPPTWAGGRCGCLQISWTTSSVSIRTATRTRSRSSRCVSGGSCSRRRSARTATATRRRLRLAEQHAPGRRAFAVEGTGSFGAGLTRFLTGHGERVLEVGRLRRERRSGGKTDALDAVRAARSVLGQTAAGDAAGRRRARGVAGADGRTRRRGERQARPALCQLRDLLITTPEPLRSELRPLTRARLLQRLAAARPDGRHDPELRGTPARARARSPDAC